VPLAQANFRNKGFYRVQYTAEMLQRLGPAIRSKKLSAADRVGIISDGAVQGAAVGAVGSNAPLTCAPPRPLFRAGICQRLR